MCKQWSWQKKKKKNSVVSETETRWPEAQLNWLDWSWYRLVRLRVVWTETEEKYWLTLRAQRDKTYITDSWLRLLSNVSYDIYYTREHIKYYKQPWRVRCKFYPLAAYVTKCKSHENMFPRLCTFDSSLRFICSVATLSHTT